MQENANSAGFKNGEYVGKYTSARLNSG